jgi:hypothetical protein
MRSDSRLRALPPVDRLISSEASAGLIGRYGRGPVLDALRAVLDDARTRLRAGESVAADGEALLAQAARRLVEAFRPTLRPVINATGVISTQSGARRFPRRPLLGGKSPPGTTLEFDLEAADGQPVDPRRWLLQEVTGGGRAVEQQW